MKRLAPTLLAAVLTVAALGSCGESKNTGAASTGSTSSGAASTNPAPRSVTPSIHYTACDQNISAGLHTTCGFADNVFRAFATEAAKGTEEASVTATSPATGKAYEMRCTTAHEITVCTGATDARVRFPLRAAKVYSRPSQSPGGSRASPEPEESAPQSSPEPEQGQGGSGSECTKGTYENSSGNIVCRPEESPTAPAGATARCADGTYSFSEHRSGTCSHHGGVAEWLAE